MPGRRPNTRSRSWAPSRRGPGGARCWSRRTAFAVAAITSPANSVVYVYVEHVVGLAGVTIAALVATAGLTGLAGLALGSRLADRIGRIPTSAAASPSDPTTISATASAARPAAIDHDPPCSPGTAR